MPGTLLRASRELVFTPRALYNSCYYYPYFIDKETESQGHSTPKWESQDSTRQCGFQSLNRKPPHCVASVPKRDGNPSGSYRGPEYLKLSVMGSTARSESC